MGGCFSGQKGLENENAPVPAPASPKSVEPTSTESVEAPKEEQTVDAPEANEEVTKDAEVVPTPTEPQPETETEETPAPVAEEKAPEAVGDAKEDAKVEEVALTAAAGSEDKAGAAPAAL